MHASDRHPRASIKQQAEHHTRLSEEQIRSHMRNYIAHVTGQVEAQAFEVSRRTKEDNYSNSFQFILISSNLGDSW